jgi:hypothetical protein
MVILMDWKGQTELYKGNEKGVPARQSENEPSMGGV